MRITFSLVFFALCLGFAVGAAFQPYRSEIGEEDIGNAGKRSLAVTVQDGQTDPKVVGDDE